MITFIIAYLIIIAASLWYVIGAKGHYIIKTLVIGFSLWYGVALYYGIPTLMGWPSTSSISGESLIISYTIKEPEIGDKGKIYLWVRVRQEEKNMDVMRGVDPRQALNYMYSACPRSYEIPYSKEAVKALTDRKNRGKLKFVKKGKKDKKGKGNGREEKDRMRYKIIVKDFRDIFKKE